jgi:hypothetical protein
MRTKFLLARFLRARSGRRWMRVIALHSCKLFSQTRELFIRALDLFVGVREPFIGARDQGIVGFDFFRIRRGVHWRFPFPSNVIRRWWSTIAPWNPAGHCRRRSGPPRRFHSAGRRPAQFIPPRSGRVRAARCESVGRQGRREIIFRRASPRWCPKSWPPHPARRGWQSRGCRSGR